MFYICIPVSFCFLATKNRNGCQQDEVVKPKKKCPLHPPAEICSFLCLEKIQMVVRIHQLAIRMR